MVMHEMALHGEVVVGAERALPTWCAYRRHGQSTLCLYETVCQEAGSLDDPPLGVGVVVGLWFSPSMKVFDVRPLTLP